MLDNEKLEDQAMLIISNAGAGRGMAFDALCAAKKGEMAEADDKLKQAEQFIHESHLAHSKLLKMDARGEVTAMDLLLTHAQDHVMTAQLAVELITEIIELYKERKAAVS